jgi:nitrogen-specific signal transduction histidine kinase
MFRPRSLRAVNIHDVLDRARRSAIVGFAADMAVREDYDPSLPLALGDPDQLLQVVLNLIKNASEAAGGGRHDHPAQLLRAIAARAARRMDRARRCRCRSKS